MITELIRGGGEMLHLKVEIIAGHDRNDTVVLHHHRRCCLKRPHTIYHAIQRHKYLSFDEPSPGIALQAVMYIRSVDAREDIVNALHTARQRKQNQPHHAVHHTN